MLWRPHDHHRGLCARLPAAPPTIGDNLRHQNRHLMITAMRFQRRQADLLLRWSSTGPGHTHSNAPYQRRTKPAMATLDGYLNHQHLLLPPTSASLLALERIAIRRTHLPHHPNPHNPVRGAFRAHHPRVRSLAAFGRRPRCKPHHLNGPASETLHRLGKPRVEQNKSALPQIADMKATLWEVCVGPLADICGAK